MMVKAGAFLSGVLVVSGVAGVLRDFPYNAPIGFPLALIGLLHALNLVYAGRVAGIRHAATLAGLAFGALVLWLGGAPDAIESVLWVLTVVAVTVLSVAVTRRSSAVDWQMDSARSPTPAVAWLYFAATAGLVGLAAGSEVLHDLTNPGIFFGVGILVGFAYALVGVLNLLNWWYDTHLVVLRWTTTGVNLGLLLILWNVPESSPEPLERLLYLWLPVAVTVLAVLCSVGATTLDPPASVEGPQIAD